MCTERIDQLPVLPQTFGDITPEEIEAAFDWSASFLSSVAKQAMPLGKAWLYEQKGMTEEATRLAKGVLSATDINHGFIQWELEGFRAQGFGRLLGE